MATLADYIKITNNGRLIHTTSTVNIVPDQMAPVIKNEKIDILKRPWIHSWDDSEVGTGVAFAALFVPV